MTHVQLVDRALDRYVANMRRRNAGNTPAGVQCATLAALAGVRTQVMSNWLQEHRLAPTSRKRYTIACEQYGRAGRWYIQDWPGAHTATIQANHVRHAIWLAEDYGSKIPRDVVHELQNALRGTVPDQVLDAECEFMKDTARAMVRRMARAMRNNGNPRTP